MKRIVALTLAASSLFLAGCSTMHHSSQLEYREVGSIDEVNQLAAQGWRVESFTVTDSTTGHYHYFLLKRHKQ